MKWGYRGRTFQHDHNELKKNESELDELIKTMSEEVSKRQHEARYAYVTCQDLYNIDKRIMVVQQGHIQDISNNEIVIKSEKEILLIKEEE
jgi:hypothetical protein